VTSPKSKSNVGGVEAVAEMLNLMDAADRERLLGEVAKRDAELASKIEEHLFVFEHLADFEDSSLQILLREVPPEVLALSLRSTSDAVKTAIFKNISARAGNALREELESATPRKLSDVEGAQARILIIAKSLLSAGKISR
jgi:flagellar motor switch protein FliG